MLVSGCHRTLLLLSHLVRIIESLEKCHGVLDPIDAEIKSVEAYVADPDSSSIARPVGTICGKREVGLRHAPGAASHSNLPSLCATLKRRDAKGRQNAGNINCQWTQMFSKWHSHPDEAWVTFGRSPLTPFFLPQRKRHVARALALTLARPRLVVGKPSGSKSTSTSANRNTST